MRLRARVDENQKQIVKALRKVGYSVLHLHKLGKGAPDILVGAMTRTGKRNFLFEIKNGEKYKSQQALTPDEKEFHETWNGQVATVTTAEEIIFIIKTAGIEFYHS